MASEALDGSPPRDHTDVDHQSPPASAQSHLPSSRLNIENGDWEKRRPKRSLTAKTYQPKIRGRQWQPGLEPGIDPAGAFPSSTSLDLVGQCEVTVVDFSERDMQIDYLDNGTLPKFLDSARPEGTTCRWINVNGLSWDVVSLLGTKYGLHRLAIEDALNRRNRTKADWYANHLFIILPLHKLVHADHEEHEDRCATDAEEGAGASDNESRKQSSLQKWLPKRQKSTRPKFTRHPTSDHPLKGGPRPSDVPPRSLQQYHGGPNEDHTSFMETHSALQAKGLMVGVEQVSIFLTADNTVVSFFEHSAGDIETPLIQRLSSPKTILRRSNDASMIVQAIMDAIIDLALPVGVAYKDAMSQIELNVLTNPAIKHTSALYIVMSETSLLRSSLEPITSLLDTLRNRSADSVRVPAPMDRPDLVPAPVTMSTRTKVYLKDVEDHIVLMTSNLDEMRRAADDMINLIFNTISAYQNESMRNLTLVTIFFLPLTFLTGYFGMNFAFFDGVQLNSDVYFWEIAIPVLVVVTVWLLRDIIYRWYTRMLQRYGIRSRRRARMMSKKAV